MKEKRNAVHLTVHIWAKKITHVNVYNSSYKNNVLLLSFYLKHRVCSLYHEYVQQACIEKKSAYQLPIFLDAAYVHSTAMYFFYYLFFSSCSAQHKKEINTKKVYEQQKSETDRRDMGAPPSKVNL